MADGVRLQKVRSGWPQANERVQWTLSSDERFGLFSVLASARIARLWLAPKNPLVRILSNSHKQVFGGWGEIRTHGGVAATPVFKTGALNHSATHPDRMH
jgi:hypothetical protein